MTKEETITIKTSDVRLLLKSMRLDAYRFNKVGKGDEKNSCGCSVVAEMVKFKVDKAIDSCINSICKLTGQEIPPPVFSKELKEYQ